MAKKLSIRQIKERLFAETAPAETWLEELRVDERKGVQELLVRYERIREREAQQLQQFRDMRVYESGFSFPGAQLAGVDEVGRGPLAGPVTAAAVILPVAFELPGLTDSKMLKAEQRELFYNEIVTAGDVGIGMASPEEIDEINIYQASRKAMVRAVKDLVHPPDHLLIDAMDLPLDVPQTPLIKGDAKSVSIAAASVVAKVTRDTYMKTLHDQYPAYRFDRNAGYGTKEHLEALDSLGPCPVHRRSFQPVSAREA
ncbi:ribonuclease HII [Natribacillus halophilus]|uniref:Ribonuclease HII n=1 Tax=Natribacillus halophilus TaxID=549003 RepID=A0A1G8MJV0_9BACI|nr:ribonuclease HII [Natribacillus halophilus]SDI68157.1 RNase HII [Natribacillus halophilus]